MEPADTERTQLKTPLYQWHLDHNGTMAEFGSYLLPLWYTNGAKAEHLAVLSTAGLFDTSHMSFIILQGPASFDLLQNFFSRDLSKWGKNKDTPLPVGRAVYGVFLNSEGCLLDDAIVFRVAQNTYFICVNAGKGPLITNHLRSQQGQYTLTDLSGALCKIDLQGPHSAKILATILDDPKAIFSAFPFFSCKGTLAPHFTTEIAVATRSGVPLLLSRSGYTGEFGFELFTEADQGQVLWEEIFAAGQSFGLMPCGLAARDSLRTGAGLPLAGHDIGSWPFVNNPWLFSLPQDSSTGKFSKDFVGAQALLRPEASFTYPFAGYDLRKIDRDLATVYNLTGEKLGRVLTCVTDMAIGRVDGRLVSINSPGLPEGFAPRGLCCGFLLTSSKLSYGERVIVQDERRKFEVEIVETIRPDCSAVLPLNQFIRV